MRVRQQKMLCHSCGHRATKTSEPPGRFLIFGCRELKYTFGLESDWISGEWLGTHEQKKSGKITDMPKKCKSFKGSK